MMIGLSLSLPGIAILGGTTGAAVGVENYLLDETSAPILSETAEELLLES